MTKRKPVGELKKRGRKPTEGDDEAVWIAIEVRRSIGGLGRTDRKSLDHALDLLINDMKETTAVQRSKSGLTKAYNRAEARRLADPEYAGQLARQATLHRIIRRVQKERGPGIAIPLRLKTTGI